MAFQKVADSRVFPTLLVCVLSTLHTLVSNTHSKKAERAVKTRNKGGPRKNLLKWFTIGLKLSNYGQHSLVQKFKLLIVGSIKIEANLTFLMPIPNGTEQYC